MAAATIQTARSLPVVARAIEQINRSETCEQADDRGDSNKPQVMLDRKTS